MFASSSKNAYHRSIHSSLRHSNVSLTRLYFNVKRKASSVSTQADLPGGRYERYAHNEPNRVLARDSRQGSLKIKRGLNTSEYNLKINAHLATGFTAAVIERVAEMKKLGVPPDIHTYNGLLQALGKECLHQEAWATILDMEAVGIESDVTSFNFLIHAHRYSECEQLYDILRVIYFLEGENLPVALRRLAEMSDNGLLPSMQVAQRLTETAAELGHARLAIDLADAYEESAVRRLDNQTWVKLLVASGEALYAEGVQRCWIKVVNELHILPDEGLCQMILHTAARHGLPTLAADALRCLEKIGVRLLEVHFTPLLESFVRNGQLKEAFRVLSLMRSNKIEPAIEATHSIFNTIRRDPDHIDNAYTALEELHNAGEVVDVSAINVVIASSAFLRDLQRAVGVYKAMPSLNVKPNVDTYDIVFSACARSRHIELAERLFAEMKDAGLKPTEKTYTRFISVILTQADYENAFFYLEEMKGRGFQPAYGLYEAIVKKCVSVGDTRYKLAVEELEQAGFAMSPGLRSYIDSGGKEWLPTGR